MIQWGQADESLRRAIEEAGLATVDGAFAFSQGLDLHKPGLGTRRRTRVILKDGTGRQHELYLKRYGPLKWWGRLGKFVSPARREFEAIRRVREAGVPTMNEIVMGEQCPLTDGRSFLVVSAVAGESLEREGAKWFTHTEVAVAQAASDKLAALVRKLHDAGLVHRDLYACHVFASGSRSGVDLYLIDLARVRRPLWRKFRWFVKDLAQLRYSMAPAWVEKHWPRFLAAYLGPERADQTKRWERAVLAKSRWIRLREERKRKNSNSFTTVNTEFTEQVFKQQGNGKKSKGPENRNSSDRPGQVVAAGGREGEDRAGDRADGPGTGRARNVNGADRRGPGGGRGAGDGDLSAGFGPAGGGGGARGRARGWSKAARRGISSRTCRM